MLLALYVPDGKTAVRPVDPSVTFAAVFVVVPQVPPPSVEYLNVAVPSAPPATMSIRVSHGPPAGAPVSTISGPRLPEETVWDISWRDTLNVYSGEASLISVRACCGKYDAPLEERPLSAESRVGVDALAPVAWTFDSHSSACAPAIVPTSDVAQLGSNDLDDRYWRW